MMNKLMIGMMAAAMLVIAGCQGRLHVLYYNDSGKDVVIESDDGRSLLADKTSVRLPSPKLRKLAMCWGDKRYEYSFPFNPRAHTMNKFMQEGKLLMRVQITLDHSLLFLPDEAPFPVSQTSLPTDLLKVDGKEIATANDVSAHK